MDLFLEAEIIMKKLNLFILINIIMNVKLENLKDIFIMYVIKMLI